MSHVSIQTFRYDVHYTIDDAIQSDVREMKIRSTNKTKKKKAKKQQQQTPPQLKKKMPTPPRKTTPKKQSGSKKRGSNFTGDITDEVKTPASKKKRGRPSGGGGGSKSSKIKGKKGKVVVAEEESPAINDSSLDEGDPPWRTSGHKHLSRKIKWNHPSQEVEKECIGTVVGWIAETDVDNEGNPGFVSSVTDEPAKLFHAVFDDFEQDFEEWELEECLM
jgi:hypothetical protein